MSQFGPTLKWPWSKLTDVPELTDALLDKISAQSDGQSGGKSVRELEQFRDDCLVAVLQGLRTHGGAAGLALQEHERALFDTIHPAVMHEGDDLSLPLRLHRTRIRPDWVDYNGHMTESRYVQVMTDATDAFIRYVGVDGDYLARGGAYFTAESHLAFLNQVRAEEMVEVSTLVLGCDEKKLHLYHRLMRLDGDVPLAEAESMLLHVDTESGRATPAAPEVLRRIGLVADAHAHLPKPERAGRRIGDRRP
jgi:carnitine 3-dehydrogenase